MRLGNGWRWMCVGTLFVGMLTLICGLAAAQAPARPLGIPPEASGADFLPESTLAMIEIRDISATRDRVKLTAICRGLADPATREFLKPVRDALQEKLDELDKEIQDSMRLGLNDLERMADGRITLALTNVSVVPGGFVGAVLMVTPRDTNHLKTCVTRLEAAIPPEAKGDIKKRKMYGVDVSEVAGTGGMPIGWAVAGNTLVVGIGNRTVPGVLRLMAEGGRSLSSEASYRGVLEGIKACNQDWMMYVSFDRVMLLVKTLGGDDANQVIAHFGLDQFKALGLAAKVNGPAVEDVLYLHMPGPRGKAAALLSPMPVDMQLLSCVPPGAVEFAIFRLNPALAYDTFVDSLKALEPQQYEEYQRGLAGAENELKLSLDRDIVRTLGEEAVIYSLPVPPGDFAARIAQAEGEEDAMEVLFADYYGHMVAMLAVKDAVRLRASARLICGLIVEKANEAGDLGEELRTEEETYKGVVVRRVEGLSKKGIVPSYAITDRFLIASISPDMVKLAVDQILAPQKNVTDTPLWREAQNYVSPGAGAISVTDTVQQVELAEALLRQGMAEGKARIEGGDRGDEAGEVFKDLMDQNPDAMLAAMKRNVIPSVAWVQTDPNGVSLRGHSMLGATYAVPAVVAVVTGFGAAKLVPTLAVSHDEDSRARCRDNLAQIGKAIFAYEGNHKDAMPKTLEELVPAYLDDAAVLRCPAVPAEELVAEGAKPHVDYSYVGVIPAREMRPITIIAYEKTANHHLGANALYFDGHVRWIPEDEMRDEFHRCLNELTPWLKNQPADVQKRVKDFYRAAE
jgi:prepilin-type processing-associated H-X9-DG protein